MCPYHFLPGISEGNGQRTPADRPINFDAPSTLHIVSFLTYEPEHRFECVGATSIHLGRYKIHVILVELAVNDNSHLAAIFPVLESGRWKKALESGFPNKIPFKRGVSLGIRVPQ
jgi:hypothetical protein